MLTRAEAERRGHLVDLMKPPYLDEVVKAGYRLPVAMVREAFERYVVPDAAADAAGLDLAIRLWDVLWMGRAAANSGAPPGSIVPFTVGVHGHGEVTLTLSIRELADGPYLLIGMGPEFIYLVAEAGQLHRFEGATPTLKELQGIVGGSIEAVPLPGTAGKPVLGYCNRDGAQQGLGANCYVVGLRYPIPGPLIVVGLEGDSHRSLTPGEVEAFSLRLLPRRPLPTLCIDGVSEVHDGEDPAIHDPYRPGQRFELPPPVIRPA